MDSIIISGIISGISIIIGAFIQSQWKLPFFKKDFKGIKIFSNPSKYCLDFYNYFVSKIENSKEDIYISGDGMEFSNKKGSDIAERYHIAFKNALNKGVKVVRIQTIGKIHPKWAEMLGELLSNHSNFNLYFIKNPDESTITNFCTIDPFSEKKNIVEIMFPVKIPFGVKKTDLVGVGIFLIGYKTLAENITNRLIDITNNSIKIKNEKELEHYKSNI